MNLRNGTIQQHYVSQVEQRMNTCTPSAKKNKQRIFSFEIDHQSSADELRLKPPVSKSIASSLVLEDLFSFDRQPSSRLRHNFESLFHCHEENLHSTTEQLLTKVDEQSPDISEELIKLYEAKLMSFLRNPYSVAKILNTFRGIANYHPTDAALEETFQLVLNGRRPHQVAMCRKLGITDVQYRQWLGLMFMMLTELMPGRGSLFESAVNGLFRSPKIFVGVLVCVYTKEKCLLSDRAFSTHLQNEHAEGMDFNLRHNAFVRYIFASRRAMLPSNTSQYVLDMSETLAPQIHFVYSVDDMKMLRGYNRNVINQSHSHVFCSTDVGIIF